MVSGVDERSCGVSLSCAAEAEGRSLRRGANEPNELSETSSLAAGAPFDDTVEPFTEGASVDVVAALPLR